ncbi:MAG: ABC transporter permease [Caulobacteraceae bacterium]|nr:ABC transporter permease [Caulobacteraceae bacterium]
MTTGLDRSGSGVPLGELVAEALGNLYAQRQRSALALLGIMIGAASIVAMLTIGQMAQLETLKLFKAMGVNMLQIHAMPAPNAYGIIDRRTIEGLAASEPSVEAAAPLTTDRSSVVAGKTGADLGLVAVTAALQPLMGLQMEQGRFIKAVDDGNLVAVVGASAAQTLSTPGAPIAAGSQVRIKDYVYTVVGVLGPHVQNALDPTDLDSAVIIPMGGAGRVMPAPEPSTAMVRLRAGADVKAAGARVLKALANPTATLQLVSAQDIIKTLNAQKAIHSRLLTAIGAISLLVGGIGVMNVMLMGVMERRREIGLRAAIGATPRDLQAMFLIEAATLAFVGGVAGLLLGLFAAFATAAVSRWSFSLPLYVVPLGPGLAALVGLVFGVYPALKASRLDPIEALRAE